MNPTSLNVSQYYQETGTNLEKKAKELIDALSSGPVRQYILDHENHDIRDIILKHKELLGIPTVQLLEQIVTRRKATEKLPLYYQTPGIIFPASANFEQSSSEATALYKCEIIRNLVAGKNPILADLTGGFGVDAYFLSTVADKIHFIEPDKSLADIARHNHTILGAHNIEYYISTAESFLDNTTARFDLIYADPSRRTAKQKKIHSLEESQPDILKLQHNIFGKSHLLLIKASPLLDLQAAIGQLTSVKKVFVISVTNECKEILFLCDKAFSGIPTVEAVNILTSGPPEKFQFTFAEERGQKVALSDPLEYLYEPNAAILKAGAFKSVAAFFKIKKIQSSTHLYTADRFIPDFPGRKFLVEKLVKPHPSDLKIYFPDGKANVTTRNYPLSPDALKKKTRLKDGGEKFLIGFSGQHKKFLAVATRL